MNFIIKLLKSKDFIIEKVYDIILMIVNYFTKYSHIIFFKKVYTIE